MASKKQTPEVPTVPTQDKPKNDLPTASPDDPEHYCPLCEDDFDEECPVYDDLPTSITFCNCSGFTVNIYN